MNGSIWPLGQLPLTANSFTAFKISSFKISQLKQAKIKTIRSRTRLVIAAPHCKLYFFFRYIFNQHFFVFHINRVKTSIIQPDKNPVVPFKMRFKKISWPYLLHTSLSSYHRPSTKTPFKPFFALLHLTTKWKKIVLRSPCFNHYWQAFYFKMASWLKRKRLYSANKILLSSIPCSSSSLSSSLASNSFIFWRYLSLAR